MCRLQQQRWRLLSARRRRCARIPLGSSIDYWGTTAPSTFFALAYGQAISQTTYSMLYTLFGPNRYGTDSGGLFNLPDLRGRVVAGKDDMGGSVASRVGSVSTDSGTITGTTLGSTGGSATHAVTSGEMPAHSHANTLNDSGHQHTVGFEQAGVAAAAGQGASGDPQYVHSGTSVRTQFATTGMTITNANAGSGAAHAILQPTIIGNKLIRVI
jgi:microcystin-dependent protein